MTELNIPLDTTGRICDEYFQAVSYTFTDGRTHSRVVGTTELSNRSVHGIKSVL